MLRALLALAAFVCVASGAAPSYSAASFVNAGNYAPGPFAPNSVVTVFGTELARSTRALTSEDIRDSMLPTELNFSQVFVDNIPAPLFYVSENQVNFLIPSSQFIGDTRIRVVRQGLSGPEVIVAVVEAAPALFALSNGFAVVTHADNTLVSPESPARGGEVIVIWATGLGKTITNPNSGQLPPYTSQIVNLDGLKISVGGTVLYAGLTPGSAGLYQINLILPSNPGVDPELRITVGAVSSAAGLKLAVR
jgi:uncharacterized protein (TIGR03437 family)